MNNELKLKSLRQAATGEKYDIINQRCFDSVTWLKIE